MGWLWIIVTIGPMAFQPITEWLPELETSEKDVFYLKFERKQGNEYVGGHWHPSVKMNKAMAVVLAARIKTITGWK